MAGGVGGGGDGDTDSKKGLEGTGLDLPENRHGNLNSASSDQNLKDLLLKMPAVINYGASWCRVCSQILPAFCHLSNSFANSLSSMRTLMNAPKQPSIFTTRPPSISTGMAKGLMRCLVLEKSGCTISCGCIRESGHVRDNCFEHFSYGCCHPSYCIS